MIFCVDWEETSDSWEGRVGRKLCITAVNLLKCIFLVPFIWYLNSARQKNDIIPQELPEEKWLTTNHTNSNFILGVVNLEMCLSSREDLEFKPGQHLASVLNGARALLPCLALDSILCPREKYHSDDMLRSKFLLFWVVPLGFAVLKGSWILAERSSLGARFGEPHADTELLHIWIDLAPGFGLTSPLMPSSRVE